MLSANAIDPSRLLEAERLYDDYLMKPIDLRQLLKTIHALLNIEWTYEPEVAAPSVPATAHGRSRFRPSATSTSCRPRRDRPRAENSRKAGRARDATRRNMRVRQSDARVVNAFDLKRYAVALEDIRSSHA